METTKKIMGISMEGGWEMMTFDPPDILQSQALADFIRKQQNSLEDYPAEKNGIYDWKLRTNPVHAGFASVMMIKDKKEIVSLCTVTPKRLWIEGEEKRCGEIGDTFTDRKYLRRGMFVSLVSASRERAQAAGYQIIYGLPNEQSAPGYLKKLNFGIKENLVLMNCTLLLSSRAIAWWLQSRKAIGSWWVPMAIRLLRNPLSDMTSQKFIQMLLPHPRKNSIVVHEEHSFGPAYDDLWREVGDKLPVAQIRDAKYLTWRYIENPFPFRILAAAKNDKLAGYLITLLQDEDVGKLRRLYLVDWLFSPSEKNTIGNALLQAALEPTYHQNAAIVTALAPRQSSIPLPWRRFGFVQRSSNRPLILHRNEEGIHLIQNTAPWHFTIGDTDGF